MYHHSDGARIYTSGCVFSGDQAEIFSKNGYSIHVVDNVGGLLRILQGFNNVQRGRSLLYELHKDHSGSLIVVDSAAVQACSDVSEYMAMFGKVARKLRSWLTGEQDFWKDFPSEWFVPKENLYHKVMTAVGNRGHRKIRYGLWMPLHR